MKCVGSRLGWVSSQGERTYPLGDHRRRVGPSSQGDWAYQRLQHLEFWCTHGSRDFRPFREVVDALNNAHSLCGKVVKQEGEVFLRDPLGLAALPHALQQHTALHLV
jgi:hypothetical protein